LFVKELIGNHSVTEYFKADRSAKPDHKKHLIIMDEVDGMGGGDRGGMAELILLIKKTKVRHNHSSHFNAVDSNDLRLQ
jgi:replication factor C subunit 1